MFNNTPRNVIVNAASNIRYRQLIQADVFAVLFMNELKNLTNVVIRKLGKLVHKQNCSHDFFYFINYNIILQLRYITIETKEVARIEYNMFLFPHSYSITTKVVSLNPAHGEVYSIQHYVIKFVSDLRQVSGFLHVLWINPPIKLTAMIYM